MSNSQMFNKMLTYEPSKPKDTAKNTMPHCNETAVEQNNCKPKHSGTSTTILSPINNSIQKLTQLIRAVHLQ